MRGFLMLEIAAALFFVSLAMLTVATWFTYTLTLQTEAVNRLRALIYATSLLEEWYAEKNIKTGTYSYQNYSITVEQKKESALPALEICTVHVQWGENKQVRTLDLATGIVRS